MAPRPSVLLTTEGTYPFVVGGVSTWCDSLVSGLVGIDWHVVAVTAGGMRRTNLFDRPPQVRSITRLELWSDTTPPRSLGGSRPTLASELARGLLGWDCDLEALRDALVWCRANPGAIASSFRARSSWTAFLEEIGSLTSSAARDGGPVFDLLQAGEAYQTLSWVARAAAAPTRPSGSLARWRKPTDGGRSTVAPVDAILVTAAGWAAIPAVVDRALVERPMVLTEHGVYVREAYLSAARATKQSASSRWLTTRLARGLARLTYANADVVAPVTSANAQWEVELGVDAEAIRTIYNGVLVPPKVVALPRRRRIVTVGRIDPLKDLATMLRCARVVLDTHPFVEFVHYGPVPEGNEHYADVCHELHRDLGLGDSFRFAGPTDDPYKVFSEGSIALFSSISEGFPMTVLEAMACGRPVVSTGVGGIPEALSGCGLTVRPGDFEGLAAGVVRLLDDPTLLASLGERSRARVRSEFGMSTCLNNYRDLLSELTDLPIDMAAEPEFVGGDPDQGLTPSRGDHAPEARPLQMPAPIGAEETQGRTR